MLWRTALAATFVLSTAYAGMAQAACSSPPALATPISLAVGETKTVVPCDQNGADIPNDPVTSKIALLQMTGIASWAVNPSGAGINITGTTTGSAATVQFQWKDQYWPTHAAVNSQSFTVNVVPPAPLVTAISGSHIP